MAAPPLRAIRFEPEGTAPDLSPVRLLGAVAVDRAGEDFFRAIVEARKRAEGAGEESRADGLKVLANATSYGITPRWRATGSLADARNP